MIIVRLRSKVWEGGVRDLYKEAAACHSLHCRCVERESVDTSVHNLASTCRICLCYAHDPALDYTSAFMHTLLGLMCGIITHCSA
jgi:hypothetical protein